MNHYSATYAKLEAQLKALSEDIVSNLQQTTEPEHQLLLKKLQSESVQNWPELMSGVYSSTLRQQKAQLEKLEAALSQIQLGMYGYCADCDGAIEPQLLEQDPSRQRCGRCDP